MFENYTRFEWGVEVGVVDIFMLRLFVPHEFDMKKKNRRRMKSRRDKEQKTTPPLSSRCRPATEDSLGLEVIRLLCIVSFLY